MVKKNLYLFGYDHKTNIVVSVATRKWTIMQECRGCVLLGWITSCIDTAMSSMSLSTRLNDHLIASTNHKHVTRWWNNHKGGLMRAINSFNLLPASRRSFKAGDFSDEISIKALNNFYGLEHNRRFYKKDTFRIQFIPWNVFYSVIPLSISIREIFFTENVVILVAHNLVHLYITSVTLTWLHLYCNIHT